MTFTPGGFERSKVLLLGMKYNFAPGLFKKWGNILEQLMCLGMRCFQ